MSIADDDYIEEALEQFALCEEAEADNRADFADDTRFARLGHQWPDQVKAQRDLDGRPCLTINAMPSFIRQVVNDGRQNKPAIAIHPSDSEADPETAEIISGLVRNIEYASNAQAAYDTALENAVTGGFGYWKVNTAYTSDDAFDQDIVIERVANPLSIYSDPYGQEVDSSDWNLAFEVDMVDEARFKRLYKGDMDDQADWRDAGGYDALNGLAANWRNGKTLRVARYWTREQVKRRILMLDDGAVVDEKEFIARFQAGEITPGVDPMPVGEPRDAKSFKVTHCTMSGTEILEKKTTWPGKFIPLVPVYGDEVNVEGKRHLRSLIRDAKDAQRNYNYWRSAATELVALAPKAPFIGPKGAFDTDADKWATANTESHAFIEYSGPIAPQRQPFAGVPAGAVQEALNANDDMKRTTGLHDASLGIRSNETSGVAIKARQREGDVSTFHYIDNLSRSIAHTGRILVDLIPRVYSRERVVRVLGREGMKDAKTARVGSAEDAQAAEQQRQLAAQQGASAEQMQEIGRIYVLGAGKYDVTVESGPSFSTQREEAAQQMFQLIQAKPDLANLIGDLFAEQLDWPGADKIAKRLKLMLPPQLQDHAQGGEQVPPQAQAQLQQAQQVIQQGGAQMQQMGAQMQALQQQLAAAQNDTALKQAELQIKGREIQVKEVEAQAKMLDAQTRSRSPIFPGGPPQGAFA